MKLAMSAFFLDETGYGEAARRVVAALCLAGADVRIGSLLRDGGPQIIPDPWLREFLDSPPHDKPDVHVIHAIGKDFPVVKKLASRVIGLTCWETNRLPDAMIQGCRAVDLVVVPSADNVTAFAAAGIPVTYVPYPIAERIHMDPIPELASLESRHVFYSVGTWQPRKNFEGTLTAILTACVGVNGIAVILKIGGGPMAIKTATEAVAQIVRELNLPKPGPKIHVLGKLTGAQIQWLHRVAGTCYVSMSRGEGFAIPVLDALDAGRTVVASCWGGHRDLLYDQSAHQRCGVFPIACRATPVRQNYPLFSGTQVWGDPDLCEASRRIRDVVTGKHQQCVRNMSHYEPAAVGRAFLEAIR